MSLLPFNISYNWMQVTLCCFPFTSICRREIRPLLVSCVLQSVSYTVYYQFAILMTGLSFLISFIGDSPLMTEGLFVVMLLTRTVKHSAFRMVPLAVRCSSEGLIAVQRMQVNCRITRRHWSTVSYLFIQSIFHSHKIHHNKKTAYLE